MSMIKKERKKDKIRWRRYISPEERQEIIDDLRLLYQCNNGSQKIINLLDNTPNQPAKFRTKN